jgi:HlyD family secretion protein
MSSPTRKRWSHFGWVKLVAGLTIAIAMLLGGVGMWQVFSASGATARFRTAAVERGDLEATISASGVIEPEELVDVGAQVAGKIIYFGPDPNNSRKTIDYGSQVDVDTVLAQLDDTVFRTRVEQCKANVLRAEADLLQMQAKLRQAERDWQRAQDLGPRKVLSGLDVDTVRANYEAAKAMIAVGEAALAQAKATLHEAEINLGYTTIKSPVKGVIVDRRVNVGQTVVASLNAPSLFLIAKDLTRLQVWASVNEADIGQIHPGQKVRFTVDAFPDEVFVGEVSQIRLNATVTQNVVTYTVVVSTDNSSGRLLPYLTANLQFQISERRDVLSVPNTALRFKPQESQVAPEFRELCAELQQQAPSSGGERASLSAEEKERRRQGIVWIATGEFVRPVPVRIGLSDGARTEIVGGDLNEGERVVVGVAYAPQASSGTVNPFLPQLRFGRRSGS